MEKKEIFNKVAEEIKKLLKDQDVDLQMTSVIQEIGLNSIDFIKLLVFIEDEFEFEFDDEDLMMDKYVIIEDVIDIIHDNANV